MRDISGSSISRRGLLAVVMAVVVGGVVGCGEPGVTQADQPAVEGGTRKRLDTFKGKALEALSKKKK